MNLPVTPKPHVHTGIDEGYWYVFVTYDHDRRDGLSITRKQAEELSNKVVIHIKIHHTKNHTYT